MGESKSNTRSSCVFLSGIPTVFFDEKCMNCIEIWCNNDLTIKLKSFMKPGDDCAICTLFKTQKKNSPVWMLPRILWFFWVFFGFSEKNVLYNQITKLILEKKILGTYCLLGMILSISNICRGICIVEPGFSHWDFYLFNNDSVLIPGHSKNFWKHKTHRVEAIRLPHVSPNNPQSSTSSYSLSYLRKCDNYISRKKTFKYYNFKLVSFRYYLGKLESSE